MSSTCLNDRVRPSSLYNDLIRYAALAVMAATFFVAGCVRTAPFKDASGHVIAGSVASMESIDINGVSQRLWFRGEDRTSPALILLHGGPGASESALFRHYNAALEKHYLVVYWEQRGAGRSYHSDIPPASMTIEQMLRDLDRVVELVRRRFHKNKLVLLGHSWGTMLGTIYAYRHPENVSAYVGVAQIADNKKGARLSCEFALAVAQHSSTRGGVRELREICPPQSVDDRLAHISAPYKKLVWFEQSAHNPPFEEPEKFDRVMIDDVLPVASRWSLQTTRLDDR